MTEEWLPLVLLFGLGAMGLIWMLWDMKKPTGQHAQQDQRIRCQSSIDSLARHLVHDIQVTKRQQMTILSLSFCELQDKLRSGEFTPIQVLQTFQLKALEVHRKTNCLQEPLVEARQTALELESEDNSKLPLYGIPVSIKDRYGIAGYEYSVGLAKLVGVRANEDCVLIKVLKQQGAIPFVKTNVPQTLMAFETSNPIFGVTTNPHNKDRSAGGSSGGEAALIAGGGSFIGLGTDIAGSIRIPAAFCGIYGLKPTLDRLSRLGLPFPSGQSHVPSMCGPMASEVDGLVAMMRALLTPLMFKLDPSVPPMPFNEQLYGGRGSLKVGYYTFDGAFHPVPACERAVLETVQTLRRLGHQVVEWDFAEYGERVMPQYFASVFGDGGKSILKMFHPNEIKDPCIQQLNSIFCMDSLKSWFLMKTRGRQDPNFRALMKARGIGSVSEWWELGIKNKELQEEIMKDWTDQGFDVILSPGFCSPALPHGLPGQMPVAMSTTLMYNFLRCPTGSVPVSRVRTEDLDKMGSYPTPDPWHNMIKEVQAGSQGLPVSVQIAALPWQDELCLRVMKEIETALK